MSDRESHDVATAAYLAREEMPSQVDGPSRQEVQAEEAEQRAFEKALRQRKGWDSEGPPA